MKTFFNTPTKLAVDFHTTYNGQFKKIAKNVFLGLCLTSVTHSAMSGSEKIIENPSPNTSFPQDTWIVEYEADDFTDEVEQATLMYIPKNFQQEAAYFVRCKPFFTNFKIEYVEQKKNLLEDGELPNATANFSKHGFVYDTEQELEVEVDGDNESYDVNVGGQVNYLTKSFKTEQKIQPGQLGMSLFFTFVAQEMPSFRAASSTDEAKDFFKQLNTALQNKSALQLQLENEAGWQRSFSLNTQRMLDAVPTEVMEFCLTKRKIK